LRGERVDIGGRYLRAVRAGPPEGGPLVVLECGAFGCAADWFVVQTLLAEQGVRSLAYDRAGLGHSDPGPEPRDARAISDDLEALVARVDATSRLVLGGHSMAGLFLRSLAPRVRHRLDGLVLVDAVTPEAVDNPAAARMIGGFRQAMFGLDRVADLGVMRVWSLVAGDRIGLPAEVSLEKRRIYATASHARTAAREVQQWLASAEQGRIQGPFDPDLPVAVVTAGAVPMTPELQAIQNAPAVNSRAGWVDRVPGALHASLLGPRYADRIVRGFEHVLSVSRAG
jgi:pimeloyl-ACP methyl ester carboxylesterase